MDPNLIFTIILLILSIVFCTVLLRRTVRSSKNYKRAPEPHGAWPIIGHFHLLGAGDRFLHRTLAAMADKCGPVFSFRMGTRRTFVVSRWEEAKECFTTNDKVLISRPVLAANKLLGYNNALFGFTPYGAYWREMRKIAIQGVLTNRQLEVLRDAWGSEIRAGIREIYNQCAKDGARTALVDLNKWSVDMILSVFIRMVVGKHSFAFSSGSAPYKKTLNRFVKLMGTFAVSDLVPYLWWLDFLGPEKEMKETAKDLDAILQRWLDEHRRERDSGQVKAEHEQDLFDVMLSLKDKGQLSNFQHDADVCIKSTCQEVIVDGSETTSSAVAWSISLVMKHSGVFKKARDELDRVVGRNRMVDESDIPKLPYLQSVIKETLRLYPAVPLLVPRESMEDCKVGGFDISKGDMVIVNVWKMHRDPRIWPDPLEFRPERFLTSQAHMDVRGQHFELLPFASGRRSCPAVSFALQLLNLTLGRLLHGFELAAPRNEPIDMTESPGMSLQRANPLEILLTPRLHADLYV